VGVIYYLRNTDNNIIIPSGDDFNKLLSTGSPGSAQSLSVPVLKKKTETSYGCTTTGDPNDTSWPDGTFTVYVYVSTSNTNITLDVAVGRVTSAGSVVESFPSSGGGQQLTATGEYIFTCSATWGSAAASDLFFVSCSFTNADDKNTQTCAIDTEDTYVDTQWQLATTTSASTTQSTTASRRVPVLRNRLLLLLPPRHLRLSAV
jgi:hypothetical protein